MSKTKAIYYYDEMIVEVVYVQGPDNWEGSTWEFFDADTGTHLNGGEVWYVDDEPVPTYEMVYENIVKPNILTGSK